MIEIIKNRKDSKSWKKKFSYLKEKKNWKKRNKEIKSKKLNRFFFLFFLFFLYFSLFSFSIIEIFNLFHFCSLWSKLHVLKFKFQNFLSIWFHSINIVFMKLSIDFLSNVILFELWSRNSLTKLILISYKLINFYIVVNVICLSLTFKKISTK